MPDPARLAAALQRMVPPGVAVASVDPRGAVPPPWPIETLPAAVPKRQAEFAAGRAAARAAMLALGWPAAAVPMRADRAPDWPPGMTGSISHSDTACLAVVVISDDLRRGIGIDLEPVAPLEPALWDTILRMDERQGMDGLLALRIFAAKEAAYKAQYACTQTLFGFQDMYIAFDGGSFTATLMRDVAPLVQGTTFQGRWSEAEGHLICAAWF